MAISHDQMGSLILNGLSEFRRLCIGTAVGSRFNRMSVSILFILLRQEAKGHER